MEEPVPSYSLPDEEVELLISLLLQEKIRILKLVKVLETPLRRGELVRVNIILSKFTEGAEE